MRFKNFLLNEQSKLTFEEAVAQIAVNCKQFLHESRGDPLYRGMGGSSGANITLSPHPIDRPPVDSSAEFNFMFNAMIDAAFNLRDVRRRSYFATGNSTLAMQFGRVCFIFPKGPFEFLWAYELKDSFDNDRKIYEQLIRELDKLHSDNDNNIEYWAKEESLENLFVKLTGRTTAHDWIHSTDNELTKTFLPQIRKDDSPMNTKIAKYWAGMDAHKVILHALINTGKYFYKNTDFNRAILRKNEIMITKSDGYYAIPRDIAFNEYSKVSGESELSPETLDKTYKWLLTKFNT